jgi:hypothetical protein
MSTTTISRLRSGWAVLVGDSIHNFCDGVIIAAAFLADVRLGWMTALAIVAHEIPQEVGDYIVLLNAGFTRARALLFNALSGLAAVVGGVLGYLVVEPWRELSHTCWWWRPAARFTSQWPTCRRNCKALRLRDTLAQLAWSVPPAVGVLSAPQPAADRLLDHQHRKGWDQHALRLAAQQRCDAAPAVRGHHDQIALLPWRVKDGLPRMQGPDGGLAACPRRRLPPARP